MTYPHTGKEIGHAKAQQAADHAGIEWQEQAFDVLCSFAKKHATFTVEAVRHANPGLLAPTDKAWGAVAIRARKAGLIAACGNVKVKGGRMLATLWEPCYFVVSGDADATRLAREAAQRERMAARFADRTPTPATADFDLPAPNDQMGEANQK